MKRADVTVLCLPERKAAIDSGCGLAKKKCVSRRSSVHRVAEGWVLWFNPELDVNTTGRLKMHNLVSNPGCYPTGAILIAKTLN